MSSKKQHIITNKNAEHVVPKAICLIRNGNRLLVHAAGNPIIFYRPPGGHIELFERSKDAIEREFMEEFSTKLLNVRFLGVLENIFEYKHGNPRKKHHEYVFVYTAKFARKEYYKKEEIIYNENGGSQRAIWLDITKKSNLKKLVPSDIEKYLDKV